MLVNVVNLGANGKLLGRGLTAEVAAVIAFESTDDVLGGRRPLGCA